MRQGTEKAVIELTDRLSYCLDVHFIGGKTLRLFYTPGWATSGEEVLDEVITEGGMGVILYTEDERPVWVYKKGLAAIEVVEAVAPKASCDATDSRDTTT